MTGGIVKANMQTSIPSIPPLPTPPGLNSGMTNESQGDQSENSSGDTAEERIQRLEAQLRKFQIDHAKSEQAFQRERETLNESIVALEARLAKSITAATAAALASLTANTPPTKTNKKHALSAANYMSAEAVEHSGIIPEIMLRTAQKGFFIPFADLTAPKYHDYALNDATIKKIMHAVETSTGLIEAEYIDDTNSDARDCVADDTTIKNFHQLHNFIKSHTLWDFNFPVLAWAEHTLQRKFFTSPFSFRDANLEREVQNAQVAYNQERSDLGFPVLHTEGVTVLKSLRPPGVARRQQHITYQEAWSAHAQQAGRSSASPTPESTAIHHITDDLVPNLTAKDSMSAPFVEVKTTEGDWHHAEDKAQIVTKYHADHFKAALLCHNLSERHPNITSWLRNGFPLSLLNPLPSLSHSFPPNNQTGAKLQENFVNKYIADEVAKGRLVGPFTSDEVIKTYGHFSCSPLNIVEKPRVPGQPASVTKWHLIIDCSARDAQGITVNDLLDLNDYPTVWDGGESVANFLSSEHRGCGSACQDCPPQNCMQTQREGVRAFGRTLSGCEVPQLNECGLTRPWGKISQQHNAQ
ncbi:hypothetical protein BS47DRAFT_1367973 [Hydnum rufescens UP504]|uniref:Uncharacterized protein n=1 Tax=Hydnum rufescens UP504 TaxID=1448309 RepID=A0A9P6DJD5_9AGAM|nr:hypothetical protein BS47DRAFT_1367973 [Hydnum rufescens UP504]